MEQLTDFAFAFNCLFEGNDGTIVPFELTISEPQKAETGDFYCLLSCPVIDAKATKIFGVDAKQATELSISFVRHSIYGQEWVDQYGDYHRTDPIGRLIEEDGSPVELPTP